MKARVTELSQENWGPKKKLDKALRINVYNQQELIVDELVSELPIVIGRHSQADIRLEKFKWLSRYHIVVEEVGGKYIARDLNSRRGMKSRGERVSSLEINGQESLSVGQLNFVFKVEEPELLSEKETEENEIPETLQFSMKTEILSLKESLRQFFLRLSQELPWLKFLQFSKPNPVLLQELELLKASLEESCAGETEMGPASTHFYQPKPRISRIVENAFTSYERPYDFEKKIGVLRSHTSLEAYVTWQGTLYDIGNFLEGDKVTVGPVGSSSLNAPVLKGELVIAQLSDRGTLCHLPEGVIYYLKRGDQTIEASEMQTHPSYKSNRWLLSDDEVLVYDLGNGVFLNLRKIPINHELKKTPKWPIKWVIDGTVKKAVVVSAVVHLIFSSLAFAFWPKEEWLPNLKGVTKHYARLLVKKPKISVESNLERRGQKGAGAPKVYLVGDEEGLSRKQVAGVISKNIRGIQKCYEVARRRDPSFLGGAEYEFLISAKGRAQVILVKKTSSHNASGLNGCIMSVFKRMKFAVAKNNRATRAKIHFPFGFPRSGA